MTCAERGGSLQQPAPTHQPFKHYAPGYVHVDVKYLPQMQDESRRRYLFVAIDRATRWVFVQIKPNTCLLLPGWALWGTTC